MMQLNPYRRYQETMEEIDKARTQFYQQRKKSIWYKLFHFSKRSILKEHIKVLELENKLLKKDFIRIETEMLSKLDKEVNNAIDILKEQFMEYQPNITHSIEEIDDTTSSFKRKVEKVKVQGTEFICFLPIDTLSSYYKGDKKEND